MLTFTSEFFFGVFIGFVLGLLLNGTIYNNQLHKMGLLTKTMKSRKLSKTKLSANKIYSPEIKKLWDDLKQLYSERIKSDPKFSFNKMVLEIHKFLDEQKAIATSIIRNFYFQRTTPQKKTIEGIQRWIDEGKKENINHSDGENGSKEIDNINNSDSKEENET